MIQHYISPVLGSMKLTEITPRVLEKYYMQLQKTKAVAKCTDKKGAGASGDAAALMKLLTNPETAGLLKALVNAMGNDENK